MGNLCGLNRDPLTPNGHKPINILRLYHQDLFLLLRRWNLLYYYTATVKHMREQIASVRKHISFIEQPVVAQRSLIADISASFNLYILFLGQHKPPTIMELHSSSLSAPLPLGNWVDLKKKELTDWVESSAVCVVRNPSGGNVMIVQDMVKNSLRPNKSL